MEKEDKRVDVEIDLSEENLFWLMKLAHERDITLNQLVNDILRKALKKEQILLDKRVSVIDFQDSDIFDVIMKDVEENQSTYTICEDEDCTIPSLKLMPYVEYRSMADEIDENSK